MLSSQVTIEQARADEEQMREAREDHKRALKRADEALSHYAQAAERAIDGRGDQARLD